MASSLRIVEASPRLLDSWDEQIERSWNGTIFHLRRFLSYHDKRFAGRERFLVALKGDTPFAQLALTIEDTAVGRIAKSPYGASYGGFVLADQPSFEKSRELVSATSDYLRAEGVVQFTMTPPIACCSSSPPDVLHFALLTNGYRSSNRDLSSVMQLSGGASIADFVSARARNMARKAESRGTVVRRGDLSAFWSLMDKTFERHGTNPTHTAQEFEQLISMLPGRVYVDVAYDKDGSPLAGIGYMVINSLVNSCFYLCQDPERKEEQALSLLLLRALERSREERFSWFDFGTSSANMIPRETIFRFKESYSKIALFRESFVWSATENPLGPTVALKS